jgi:DNA-binding NarL/FixJ family response regulator
MRLLIEMAGLSGLTATHELCAAHPEARVIIVTKHKDEATRAAAFKNGACGFVAKENLPEQRD